MARLPTRDDLGGLPSARSGRIIANFDTSAAGRGLADLGASIAGASDTVGRLGASVSSGAIGGASQAEKFETNRRFLEFVSGQQQAYEDSKSTVDPGAFGFREQSQKRYMDAAKAFFSTVPKSLQPEYDAKLFAEEDDFLNKSRAFETTERTRYYGDEVNKGLTTIESTLFSDPGSFDKNFNQGLEFINAIPDESLSRIQKADLAKQWRTKAQLASLNGVTDQERIRLLTRSRGVPDQPRPTAASAQAITRGISGDIRKTISDAAAAYGIDPNALLTIAWIESKGDPNAKNPESSAGGLFQFINSTAAAYGLQNKFDPAQAADAAARLTRDNSEALQKVLGREPTTGELYLAHQQGIGGATNLLSNPDAKAVDVVGADAVRLNGGTSDMTAGDFAMLWMKKAGDTQVPDGGVFNAKFDPARADPRFADMDYQTAQKVIAGAQAGIEASMNDAKRAEADRTAASKVQYDQHKGSVELGIETGELNSELSILNDEFLTDAHKADLLKAYRAKAEKTAASDEAIRLFSEGALSVNPYDSDQTKVADDAYERMSKNAGTDDERGTLAAEFAESTGYIPKKVQSEIRRGAASTDPEAVAQSMRAATALQKSAPISFNSFDGGDSVRKNLDLYRTYTDGMGLDPEEAAQKIIDLKDPEKIRQRDAILKSDPVKKALKAVDASDVAAIFDKGILSPAPDVGGVPSQEAVKVGVNAEAEAAIVADYRGILEESLADAGGDMDTAKELAKSRFEKNYGVSDLSPLGPGIVIKYPPERVYPAMQDGTNDYIRNQAIEALKAEGVEPDAIYLQGYEGTEQDIKAGKNPRYQLFYEQDGKMQRYFLPFYANPETAKAEISAKQEESMRAAEEEMLKNRAEEQYRFPEGRGRVERFRSGKLYRGIAREGSPLGEAIRRAQDENERIRAVVDADKAEEDRRRAEFEALPAEEQRERSLGDFLGGPVQLPRK